MNVKIRFADGVVGRDNFYEKFTYPLLNKEVEIFYSEYIV